MAAILRSLIYSVISVSCALEFVLFLQGFEILDQPQSLVFCENSSIDISKYTDILK